MSNIAWSPEERLDAYGLLQGAGFAGLEIAPGLFFHEADDPLAPDEASASRALEEARTAGLELVSMQSLLFGVTGAALFEGLEERQRFKVGISRAIDLAGRFDIPNLVFGSPRQRCVPDGMPMDSALTEAAELFGMLGDRAAAARTKIAIEANPAIYGTNFLNTLEDAISFVDLVDHPAVVAILDLGAMHINGDFAAVPRMIPNIASRLNHVHVSEPHLAPAPASANALTPVLKALRGHGYKGAVSIEMKRPDGGLAEVEAAIARLAGAAQSLGVCHA